MCDGTRAPSRILSAPDGPHEPCYQGSVWFTPVRFCPLFQTSVYICLLEPLSDGNYQVVLATMMPMTGPEDALFRVTELDSDYWDSLDNIARPGMVMAVAVETSDVGNLAHGCGVSFKHADQDVCGTTYTYVGNLQLGTIVDRSQMTANQRCMKMSLQLVVDI